MTPNDYKDFLCIGFMVLVGLIAAVTCAIQIIRGKWIVY